MAPSQYETTIHPIKNRLEESHLFEAPFTFIIAETREIEQSVWGFLFSMFSTQVKFLLSPSPLFPHTPQCKLKGVCSPMRCNI